MTKQTPVVLFPDASISTTPTSYTIKVPDVTPVHGSVDFRYVPGRIKSIYSEYEDISGAATMSFAICAPGVAQVLKYITNKDILESFGVAGKGSVFFTASEIFGEVGTTIPTDDDGNITIWILTDAGTATLSKLAVTFDQE